MKRYIAWIAGLGLAGVCLGGLGCSGGDVPDPESDAQAAGDSAPEGSPPAPAPKADESVAAQEVAPTSPSVETRTSTASPVEPPRTAAESTPKADPGSASATSEMLAIATAPPSGDSGSTPPPGAAAVPPGPGAMPAMPAMPSGPPGTPANPGSPPGYQGPGANPNIGRAEGMPIPGAGGDGAPGGSGKRADFTNPLKAVTAFLDALRERDAELLADATAFRAVSESHVNNRKLFASILDHSISDDDFDDLIAKLDGYQISFLNTPHSSGRQGVVLEKTIDRHTYRRTIEVRREKAGWKVVDVGGERDLSASVSGVRSKPRVKKP